MKLPDLPIPRHVTHVGPIAPLWTEKQMLEFGRQCYDAALRETAQRIAELNDRIRTPS